MFFFNFCNKITVFLHANQMQVQGAHFVRDQKKTETKKKNHTITNSFTAPTAGSHRSGAVATGYLTPLKRSSPPPTKRSGSFFPSDGRHLPGAIERGDTGIRGMECATVKAGWIPLPAQWAALPPKWRPSMGSSRRTLFDCRFSQAGCSPFAVVLCGLTGNNGS